MNPDNLSLSQIANRIGVTPSALSQWQKRYKDDFPPHVEEVGLRRSYRLADIEAFIARHDLPIGKINTKEQNSIWQTANILRGSNFGNLDCAIVIAFFACLWSRNSQVLHLIVKNGSDALTNITLTYLREGQQRLEQLKLNESQIRQIAIIWLEYTPLASDKERERICKQIYSFIESSTDKSDGMYYTPQSLADLINEIGRGLEILDISTGVGTVLNTYANESKILVGQDCNAGVIYMQQLLDIIRFGDPRRKLSESDSLQQYRPDWKNRFDVVICDSPFNSKPRPEFIQKNDERWKFFKQTSNQAQTDYWIQTALAYLRTTNEKQTGVFRGIVVIPSGWLFNGNEQAMREALVSAGHIEAVIELGGGLYSGTAIPVNLLILRNTNPPIKQVRVIDATDLGALVRGRRKLGSSDIAKIVAALTADTKENQSTANLEDSNTIFFRDISFGEMLDNDWVLQPRRYRLAKKKQHDSVETLSEVGVLIRGIEKTLSELTKKLQLDDIKRDFSLITNFKNQEVRSFKLSNSIDLNSPFEVLFKNRKMGTEWTSDDIRAKDIVVCLTGPQIGESMFGDEFLLSGQKWFRVLQLRILNNNIINPTYVYAWLKFGGFREQVERLAGGTLLKTISKNDINRIMMPIPTLELQKLFSSLVTRMDLLHTLVKEVHELNQSFMTKTQELLSSMLAVYEIDDDDSIVPDVQG